jgi:hypothetical protein
MPTLRPDDPKEKGRLAPAKVAYELALLAWAATLAIAPPVFAADEISPLPDLDACIAAALKERPGALFGWRELGVGSYKISVITSDGKIGDASCSGSALAGLGTTCSPGSDLPQPA